MHQSRNGGHVPSAHPTSAVRRPGAAPEVHPARHGASIALIAVFAAVAWGAGRQTGGDPSPPAFQLPQVELMPLAELPDAGSSGEAAARADQLRALIEATHDPLVRAELMLALANWTLARQLEPAASRHILRLDERAFDASARRLLDEVMANLDAAERELRDSAPSPGAPAESAAALSRQATILRTFADALRVIASSHEDGRAADDGSTRPDAAAVRRELSTLLEADQPAVTSATAMWLAELPADRENLRATLRVLDPVLREPSRESPMFGLYQRLGRCRILAADGGYGAALTLLMQLEERCVDWFEGALANAAGRTVAWNELLILKRWHDDLPPDASDERQWCLSRFDQLVTRHFQGGDATAAAPSLARLGLAIPLLVSISDEELQPTAPPSPPSATPEPTPEPAAPPG